MCGSIRASIPISIMAMPSQVIPAADGGPHMDPRQYRIGCQLLAHVLAGLKVILVDIPGANP
jgi:hypothetical protein